MKVAPLLTCLVTLLVVAGASADAGATSNFPAAIQTHVGASTVPACTVCHQSDQGGKGTVTQPFGIAMRNRGLVAYDVGSLNTALDALAAEGTDTDGDGVADVDELKRGTDPNVPNLPDGGVDPNATAPSNEQPQYGCAVPSSAPAPRDAPWSLVVLLGLAGLGRRRRR